MAHTNMAMGKVQSLKNLSIGKHFKIQLQSKTLIRNNTIFAAIF